MTSHLAWSHGFQPDSGCGRLLTSSERNCRSGTRLPSPSLTSASWSMQSPNSRRPCLHHQTTAAGSDTLSIVSKHHRQFTVDLSSPHRLNGKLIFVLSTSSCLQLQSAAYWCCTAPLSLPPSPLTWLTLAQAATSSINSSGILGADGEDLFFFTPLLN